LRGGKREGKEKVLHAYLWPSCGGLLVFIIIFYVWAMGEAKGAQIEFAVIIIPHALRLLSAIFFLRNSSVPCTD
jgi:hypothetical protein